MSKKFKNEVVLGYNGKPVIIQIGDERRDLKTVDVFQGILNNAPLKTQQDSINGMRLQLAIDKARDADILEMDEGVHDWIKPIAEQITPQMFRINGSIIYDLVKEGFIK